MGIAEKTVRVQVLGRSGKEFIKGGVEFSQDVSVSPSLSLSLSLSLVCFSTPICVVAKGVLCAGCCFIGCAGFVRSCAEWFFVGVFLGIRCCSSSPQDST